MIDMSKFNMDNVIIIRWLDHSNPEMGSWHELQDAIKTFNESPPETMVTVGWLVGETEDRYMIASTANVDGQEGCQETISDINFILKAAVVEIQYSNGQKLQRTKVEGKKAGKRSSSKKKSS